MSTFDEFIDICYKSIDQNKFPNERMIIYNYEKLFYKICYFEGDIEDIGKFIILFEITLLTLKKNKIKPRLNLIYLKFSLCSTISKTFIEILSKILEVFSHDELDLETELNFNSVRYNRFWYDYKNSIIMRITSGNPIPDNIDYSVVQSFSYYRDQFRLY